MSVSERAVCLLWCLSGLEWLEPVLSWEPAVTSLLEGFLPPLLLSLFFSLVPPLMRYLSVLQLLPSYSAAESSAITKVRPQPRLTIRNLEGLERVDRKLVRVD
jgi:hypothetical protein